jgi:hypothetical protein
MRMLLPVFVRATKGVEGLTPPTGKWPPVLAAGMLPATAVGGLILLMAPPAYGLFAPGREAMDAACVCVSVLKSRGETAVEKAELVFLNN